MSLRDELPNGGTAREEAIKQRSLALVQLHNDIEVNALTEVYEVQILIAKTLDGLKEMQEPDYEW